MKPLKKKVSLVLGGLAASILAVSMMAAPALADDPVHRTQTGAYTEVVPYSSGNTETASTEALIDTEFHYFDYSPDIDVTYSWNEDLEWTYIKNGKYGFWTKGDDKDDSWYFVRDVLTSRSLAYRAISHFNAYDDSRMSESHWSNIMYFMENTDQPVYDYKAGVISFANNAAHELYASLEEQGISIAATSTNNKSYSATSYSEKGYLNYIPFIPEGMGGSGFERDGDFLTQSIVIGTGTGRITSKRIWGNEYYVGIAPKPEFKPANAWLAESSGGSAIQAQIKIIFTKKD